MEFGTSQFAKRTTVAMAMGVNMARCTFPDHVVIDNILHMCIMQFTAAAHGTCSISSVELPLQVH